MTKMTMRVCGNLGIGNGIEWQWDMIMIARLLLSFAFCFRIGSPLAHLVGQWPPVLPRLAGHRLSANVW